MILVRAVESAFPLFEVPSKPFLKLAVGFLILVLPPRTYNRKRKTIHQTLTPDLSEISLTD